MASVNVHCHCGAIIEIEYNDVEESSTTTCRLCGAIFTWAYDSHRRLLPSQQIEALTKGKYNARYSEDSAMTGPLAAKCPTCSAEPGKPCSKRFTDWEESLPHETRVEAAAKMPSPLEADTVPPSAPPESESLSLPHMEGLFTEPDTRSRRRLSRNETSQRYRCELCGAGEEYRAVDNVARYAHLCRECWADATMPQREHYERLRLLRSIHERAVQESGESFSGLAPVPMRGSALVGFSRSTVPPKSTAAVQALPQFTAFRPTHLYIVQRSGPKGVLLSSLRTGNMEHLVGRVPIEVFEPLSNEIAAELMRKYPDDDEAVAQALDNYCQISMGTGRIGNALTLHFENPSAEPCVVDAAVRIDTVEGS